MSNKLYEQYFLGLLKLDPSINSILEIKKYRHLKKYYPNLISEESIAKQKKFYQKFDKLLKKVEKEGTNDENEKYYNFVLRYEINMSLEGFKYPLELMPITQMYNSVLDYMEDCSGNGLYKFENDLDYKYFIFKTNEFAKWCDQAIINMRKGIKRGYILPIVITHIVIEQIAGGLKMKSYTNNNVPKSLKSEWDICIQKYLVGSSKKMLDFLKIEYLPNCRKTLGYYDLPNGKKLYDYIIRLETTDDDLNAEKIHKIGLKEVARVYGEMLKIKNKMRFKGSLDKFNEYIANQKKYNYKNKKNLMDDYKKIQNNIWKNLIPKYFDKQTIPSYNYKIKPVPKFKQDYSASAYYITGDLYGKRKGTFYLNLRDPEHMLNIDAIALSLHEGNPGHHFQQTIMMDSKKIPLFVKIGGYTSYVEGWALYVENLGNYKNLMDYYGKLNSEMMRSVRLVLDTGIHHYGWDFLKCREYYMKYTSFPITEIDAELYRYTAMPGQAVSYKVGELKFLNLKKNFKGDIKLFHRLVLENGNAPLEAIEQKLKNYK